MPPSLDYIELRDMAFFAHHGALKEENTLGQRFFVSIKVGVDLRQVGESDRVSQTINYADLHTIAQAMQGGVVSGEVTRIVKAAREGRDAEPPDEEIERRRATVSLASGREIEVPLGPYKLLESLGHQMALVVLQTFDQAVEVDVTIRKPSVPIAGILDHAAIGIHRTRDDL